MILAIFSWFFSINNNLIPCENVSEKNSKLKLTPYIARFPDVWIDSCEIQFTDVRTALHAFLHSKKALIACRRQEHTFQTIFMLQPYVTQPCASFEIARCVKKLCSFLCWQFMRWFLFHWSRTDQRKAAGHHRRAWSKPNVDGLKPPPYGSRRGHHPLWAYSGVDRETVKNRKWACLKRHPDASLLP